MRKRLPADLDAPRYKIHWDSLSLWWSVDLTDGRHLGGFHEWASAIDYVDQHRRYHYWVVGYQYREGGW